MFRPLLTALAALIATSLAPLQAQSNNLYVGPSTLTFNGVAGGIPTGIQTLSASSLSTPLALNVTVENTDGTTTNWLKISATNGVTPFNVSVYADPTGLKAGTYFSRVNFFGSFGATVFVNFVVTGGTSVTPIVANPSSFSINASSSGGPITQTISLSSATSGVGFNVSTSTTSGGNWLTVLYSTNNQTPATITIQMDPTLLYSQSYTGNIVVTPISGGSALNIPVTMNVNGSTTGFTISATNIPVNYQINTSYPATQQIFINNSSGAISYTATSSQPWAMLSTGTNPTPSSTTGGLTGNPLFITILPSGLTAGIYTSYLSITASTGQTLNATVTLNVSNSGFFIANPNSLTFNYGAGLAPGPQTVVISSSSGAAINFTANASSNGNWLTVSPGAGNTSGNNTLTVSVPYISLTNGTYSGSITLTDIASGVTTAIPVTLNYGVTGGTNQLTITPSSVSLQAGVGGVPVSQVISVAAYSGASQNFQVTASATPAWLSVAPGVGVTPSTITVVAAPTQVPGPGTYNGNLLFTNFDGSQQTIPVSFNVTSNANFAAAPTSLAFSQAVGAPTPAAQIVKITTTSGPLNSAFTAVGNAAWLNVTTTAGTTPGSLLVSASAASLSVGTYNAQITVSGGLNQLVIPVSFTVQPANTLSLSSTSLNFNYQAGLGTPAPQVITVSSPGGAVPFTTQVATSIGGNWLIVSQSAGSTPSNLAVSINPAGLTTGIYPGTITLTSSDGSNQKLSININLTVSAPPAPQITKVLHAATMQATWLSPGLIVVLQGIGMGPVNTVNGTLLAPGAVDTIAGGTRVLFDGVAAPVLSANATSVLAVVPYGVSGKVNSNIVVEYQGVQSNPFGSSVFDSAPGIFTRDGSGLGQAAINNENGSPNSPANPAALGSVISIFGTGEGNTIPLGQDGRIIVTDLRVPVLPVRFFINGRQLDILYAGSAPGFVAGSFQVNVRIPIDLPTIGSLPIELQVGSRASQSNITVAVK